ncbi:response regulator, partial [Rhizobium ruizarguesonis]
ADLGVTVDAVVLDYHMPDMNGAYVARRLRSDPRFVELPIIFLTSMDISVTEKEFAAGAHHLDDGVAQQVGASRFHQMRMAVQRREF